MKYAYALLGALAVFLLATYPSMVHASVEGGLWEFIPVLFGEFLIGILFTILLVAYRIYLLFKKVSSIERTRQVRILCFFCGMLWFFAFSSYFLPDARYDVIHALRDPISLIFLA